MKKILLIGNPNVGKSVFFSRLTGVQVITSNYPGTTVGFTKGYMNIGGERYEVIDVPGTYSLEPTCKAEEVANNILEDGLTEKGNIVINVVDATNLERNLYLTLELMEKKIPIIVALNMWDETKHKGIHIDLEKLSDWLSVPVVPTVAVTGEGFAGLKAIITSAYSPSVRTHSFLERWKDIGKIILKVQKLEHRHHTIWEKLQDLTIKPSTGLPIAVLVIYSMFKIVRFIGESLISYVFEPLFNDFYSPLILKLSSLFGSTGFWHDVLIGQLISGEVDYFQSFGILTTGLYVPIAAVLPYLFSFYLVLGVMEDSGYLPRLATLLDNLMHKIGLHGFSIVPALLSLGCNVPGIMATRILESKRERIIAATLISVGIPCTALQAMILGVLGDFGGAAVITVYLTLFLTLLILGFILNKFLRGYSPELLIEIPPYRLPPWKLMSKKLWWRIKAFLKEALPIVLVGVFIINILYVIGLFDLIIEITAPVVTGLLGLPKEAVAAIVIGLFRKDIGIGMLTPLGLDVDQYIVACVVLAMFFPCIATYIVMLKELGYKDMLKATGIMIVSAVSVGAILNCIIYFYNTMWL